MNFRQVEAFRAVMLTGSVTKAAKAMNVTQPAVSRLLKDFASQTGLMLFERDGAGVRPTEQARQLFEEVNRAYVGLDNIMHAALQIRQKDTADLSIIAISAIAITVIPEMVQSFLRKYGPQKFLINTLNTQDTINEVKRSAISLGIVELPVAPGQLSVERLPTTRAVAVLPKGHRLAQKKSLSATDFQSENFIALPGHLLHRMKVDRVFAETRVRPRVVVEARSSVVAARLVSLGVGVSILDPFVADASGDELECRPVTFSVSNEYAVIYNVEKQLSKRERNVCDYLHDRFAEYLTAGSTLSN